MAVVDLDDVRWQLRIDSAAEDDQLASLVEEAQDYVERCTGLVLEQREVVETFDSFERLRLRAWPIAADATVALIFLDAAGGAQMQAGYRLLVGTRPARLEPSPGVHARGGPVTATFVAGYAEPPPVIRRAMLVLISGYYSDREGGETAKAAEAAAEGMLRRAGFYLYTV